MAVRRLLRRGVAIFSACTAAACGSVTSAPVDPEFVLVTVDGQPLPYQVGVTTSGQPLIVYSGGVRNVQNGQCTFDVRLDANLQPLDFSNQYFGTEPRSCNLKKGETREFTYNFVFRNSALNTPHTYGYR